jgi:hypothetical protein
MRSFLLTFACGAFGLALLMCGSDDGAGAGGSSGGADGGGGSSSGTASSSGGSSGGSSGNGDSGPTAGPKRPTFASAKVLPQVHRVVALPAGGWAVLTQQVTQATVIDGVTLQTGGPVLLKTDPGGVVQWAKTLTTGGGSQNGPPRLTVDDAGNLYVSGLTYTSTIDFGDGITTSTGDSQTQVAFVGQIDASGTAKWLRLVYTPQGIWEIQVAARNGKVAVGGSYSPYTAVRYTASDGIKIAPLLTRDSHDTAYLLQLNASDGYANWAKIFGAQGNDQSAAAQIHDVAIDAAGDITAAGTYAKGPLVELVDTTVTPFTTPLNAGYVMKVDTTGARKWIRTFENAGLEHMTADATRILAAGSMKVDVDFGMGVRKGPAFFAVAIDPTTSATIADKTFGGGGTDMFAMAHDPAGGTALGYVVPTATAGGVVDNIQLPIEHSTFVVKLGVDLKAHWLESFARPEAGSPPVFPAALAVDANGKTAFGGTLTAAHDFGGGPITAPNGFVVWYTQ